MAPRRIVPMLAAALAVATLTTCDPHEPAGPGPGDTTPPSVVTVVGWDVNHVVAVFDERVTRESADYTGNYTISGEGLPAARGEPALLAPMSIQAVSLHSDNRTVTLTTNMMLPIDYSLVVTGVSDTHRNRIVKKVAHYFFGSEGLDVTPPEIVYQAPAPGATNVSTGTVVMVGFSEPTQLGPFVRGFKVRGGDARLLSARSDDGLHYACGIDLLQPDSEYTISVLGAVDLAGNKMPDTEWTFRTALVDDSTPPELVSSRPAHGSVNIDVATDLSLTFSEPMDPFSVIVRGPVNDDEERWSNGGRTISYATTWRPGQYTVQIRPGEMRDASGNPSTRLFTVTFSTGGALENGSFSGTITGDAHSANANDPSGGLVFAGPTSPSDLYTSVVAIVEPDHTYRVMHLPNHTYYPFYVADSNDDGLYQPAYGDAIGIYGVSDWTSNQEPQTVAIADAPVGNIDFVIYDPSAIYGLLTYTGTFENTKRVALFATEGFDPMTSVPVVAVDAGWNGAWDYVINSLDVGPIPDGTYYVAAYVDTGGNGLFDPAVDPFGIYGGDSPIAVDLSNGRDVPNIGIELHDPVSTAGAAAVEWRATPRNPRVRSWLHRPVNALQMPR